MNLEWNAAGWFGGQLGGTAWILVTAALTTARDASTGFFLLVIFLVPNIIGYSLWRMQKMSYYASLQILLYPNRSIRIAGDLRPRTQTSVD